MKILYFVTTLTKLGHCFFDITNGNFNKSEPHDIMVKKLMFDPENLPYNKELEYEYARSKTHTVISISKSPADHRGGSKSVFIVEEEYNKSKMLGILKNNRIFVEVTKALNINI